MSESLWNDLVTRCEACQKCSLCKTRTHTVFGVGDRRAELMFVGEAPGLTAVYHPAALLRDASKKEDMLLDMERIKEQLDRINASN